MRKYKYYISVLPEIGNVTIHKLIENYGDAKEVCERFLINDNGLRFFLKGMRYSENKIDAMAEFVRAHSVEAEYTKFLKANIKVVFSDEPMYPMRLRTMQNRPYALFYIGNLPEDEVPAVAIIGARKCSEYGRYLADAFGRELSLCGINIISGMALGVDGIAQDGALSVNGKTFGILGSGVDVCYPRENKGIYEAMQKKGGVLSIFRPGQEPIKRLFPERNRIVAALSDIILVVEAKQKSGTAITVELALKMGKDVYAVPGRITDRLSDGCNVLIRNGAGVALSPKDVMKELQLIWQREHPKSQFFSKTDNVKALKELNKEPYGSRLLRILDTLPMPLDEILKCYKKVDSSVTIEQLSDELITLCMSGKLKQIGNGYFYKVLDR